MVLQLGKLLASLAEARKCVPFLRTEHPRDVLGSSDEKSEQQFPVRTASDMSHDQQVTLTYIVLVHQESIVDGRAILNRLERSASLSASLAPFRRPLFVGGCMSLLAILPGVLVAVKYRVTC